MKESYVEVASILSHRTKQGMVEFVLNGEKTQWDVAKAREIIAMIQQATEAAITDTLIYQFMRERIGMDEDKAARVLLDFRDLRQGSKSVVYPT